MKFFVFLAAPLTTKNKKKLRFKISIYVLFSETGKYETEVGKGDDGWMDWRARKTCNYITDAVKVNSIQLSSSKLTP